MTSKDILNRVLHNKKAKKVNQLSEIAALFEKEQRVEKQIKEVEQFKESLLTELENNEEFRKALPRNFLEQEDDKRNELIQAVLSFQLVAESQADEIRDQQSEEHKKLALLDYIIDRVDKDLKRQQSIREQILEISEAEENRLNV